MKRRPHRAPDRVENADAENQYGADVAPRQLCQSAVLANQVAAESLQQHANTRQRRGNAGGKQADDRVGGDGRTGRRAGEGSGQRTSPPVGLPDRCGSLTT